MVLTKLARFVHDTYVRYCIDAQTRDIEGNYQFRARFIKSFYVLNVCCIRCHNVTVLLPLSVF